jgi:hypothetical protein
LAAFTAHASAEDLRPYEIVGDAIPASLTGAPGDPERGREIVGNRQVGLCLLCHTGPFPQARFQGNLAPDLAGAGTRASIGQLRLRIVDASRLHPEHHHAALLSGRWAHARRGELSRKADPVGGTNRRRGCFPQYLEGCEELTAELTIDQGRRTLIKGAGALACGLLLTVHRSDATPASMQTAIRSVFGNAEIGRGKVTIDIPSLVENGNTVPMTVSVDSPMAAPITSSRSTSSMKRTRSPT